MSDFIQVAYWTNSFGEEMASRVHSAFAHGDATYVVVHDWREGTRGHGLIVLPVDKLDVLRIEFPR